MSNADVMKQMQVDTLNGMIKEANELIAQVNAAQGNKDELFESIANREEFADLRNQIAELQEQLEAAVNVQVEQALANKTDNTAELNEKIKGLTETIKPGISYFKKLYGEKGLEDLVKLDRVKGTRTGGGGTGGKRIRGYNWVVTLKSKEGETTNEYENAANAAKALAVDTKTLQEQFFAKAGVEQIKDAPDEVILTANFKGTDGEGNEYPIEATIRAYRTAPAPKDEDSESEAAEVNDDTDVDLDPEDLEV